MIPRTKVTYTLSSLIKALLVSEKGEHNRQGVRQKLAQLLGSPHILLTASGRGALYLLLLALTQRKVVMPAYTCKAVAEAALLAGKDIHFIEPESNGFNMDTEALQGVLDADTVLVATHQFGIPCQLDAVLALAHQAGAFVVEDAAASLGSCIAGRLTGTFGDAAFFSLDSTKLLNVPLKGGFLWVRDPDLFFRCQEVQQYKTRPMPLLRKFHYLILGFVLLLLEHPLLYRIFHTLMFRWRGRFTADSAALTPCLGPFYQDHFTEWQAVMLLPQLARFRQIVETRRRLYSVYLERLAGVHSFALPPADIHQEWAPIRFPIRVYADKLEFYEKAVRQGVDFAFSFTFLAAPPSCVLAHKLAAMVLDLPFYDRLTPDEMERVIAVLWDIDRKIQ